MNAEEVDDIAAIITVLRNTIELQQVLGELKGLNAEKLLQTGAKMETLIAVKARSKVPDSLKKWWAMRPLQQKLVAEQETLQTAAIQKLSEKLEACILAIDGKKHGGSQNASWKAALSEASSLATVYSSGASIHKGELAVALFNGWKSLVQEPLT